MANKVYSVTKHGETIKELKSLPAAKKLANTEEAEVFCEGECIYAPDQAARRENFPEGNTPVKAGTVTPEKYTLIAKMNIRKKPSITAEKIGTTQAGVVVDVIGIENGWLHLKDGSFILYEGGKWARKC